MYLACNPRPQRMRVFAPPDSSLPSTRHCALKRHHREGAKASIATMSARLAGMNPRRVIVLTCSVLLVLLGLLITFLMPTIPAAIIGLVMAVSGVSSFAKTI